MTEGYNMQAALAYGNAYLSTHGVAPSEARLYRVGIGDQALWATLPVRRSRGGLYAPSVYDPERDGLRAPPGKVRAISHPGAAWMAWRVYPSNQGRQELDQFVFAPVARVTVARSRTRSVRIVLPERIRYGFTNTHVYAEGAHYCPHIAGRADGTVCLGSYLYDAQEALRAGVWGDLVSITLEAMSTWSAVDAWGEHKRIFEVNAARERIKLSRRLQAALARYERGRA